MSNFKKKQKNIVDLSNAKVGYAQLDITEEFGDNQGLSPEDWIQTVPLNITSLNPEASGLPSKDATDDKIHDIATTMSMARDNANSGGDGVYCPVCHIASVDFDKLHQPCPKCGRPLLRFGWD